MFRKRKRSLGSRRDVLLGDDFQVFQPQSPNLLAVFDDLRVFWLTCLNRKDALKVLNLGRKCIYWKFSDQRPNLLRLQENNNKVELNSSMFLSIRLIWRYFMSSKFGMLPFQIKGRHWYVSIIRFKYLKTTLPCLEIESAFAFIKLYNWNCAWETYEWCSAVQMHFIYTSRFTTLLNRDF